jgi:hypothetical protein
LVEKLVLYLLNIIILYSYIFSPAFTFLPIGMDKMILIISFLYISYKSWWGKVINNFKKEFVLILLILFFSLFTSFINSNYGNTLGYDLLLLIEVIPVSFFIFKIHRQSNFHKFENIYFLTSSIAAIITLYLVVNPVDALYLKKEVLKFPEELIEKFYYRGYGLSDGLFFSYPVIQGFFLAFIVIGFYRNPAIYFLFLLLVVSIVTNARSGFIPVFIAFFIAFFSNSKWLFKFSLTSILSLFISFGTLSVFLAQSDVLGTSFEWGMSTFDILDDLSKGEKAENVDVLFSDMLVFPDSVAHWILGSGEYLFLNETNRNTDIGYLLRLNYGGIIYFLCYILLAIYMSMRLFRVNRELSLIMFLSLIYLNFKADFFIINPASRFFFLIYVLAILSPSFLNLNVKNQKM